MLTRGAEVGLFCDDLEVAPSVKSRLLLPYPWLIVLRRLFSDVFSFWVILYELATGEEPWKSLSNPIQVVGAVGYNRQRLPIPDDVQPEIAALLKDCWSEEPQQRPSFQEIIRRLSELKQLTPSMSTIAETAAKESGA